MNKRRKKRRELRLFCGMAVAAVGVGIISLSLAVRALAAPEGRYTKVTAVRCVHTATDRAVKAMTETADSVKREAQIIKEKREHPLIALEPGHGGCDEGSGTAEGIDPSIRPKTMYLTFDDGPSPVNTLKVLDILKEKEIQATFFLVGENVRRYPEVAKRIAAEGHTIGIHCDSHDYGRIYESADCYLADFARAHQTVLEVTGVDAKLFRFPGGSINSFNEAVHVEIAERMEAMGYVYFDWNASLQDAVKNPSEKNLLANAAGSVLGRRKVVLLAHDVVEETGNCLEELLDMFPEYEMKQLSEKVKPIQF